MRGLLEQVGSVSSAPGLSARDGPESRKSATRAEEKFVRMALGVSGVCPWSGYSNLSSEDLIPPG